MRAPISFRVNPDVDPKTHPYIATGLKESKFGVAFDDARALYRRAAQMPSIVVRGIDMHIGSQITELAPYREAAARMLALVDALAADGIALDHVDLGGGLGIRYRDEAPVGIADYAAMVRALFDGRRERLLFEPGRRLVGDAGVLLTRVAYLKPGATRNFAIVDAAMNDLLRPALYDAWHPSTRCGRARRARRRWDIVGPICESGDFLALDRELALARGDLLADPRRGRVRDGDELELQRAAARLRSARRRRRRASDSPPRDCRRTSRARNSLADVERALTRRANARECASRNGVRIRNSARSDAVRSAAQILQKLQTWLQCRQQVPMDLSRGRLEFVGNERDPRQLATPAQEGP